MVENCSDQEIVKTFVELELQVQSSNVGVKRFRLHELCSNDPRKAGDVSVMWFLDDPLRVFTSKKYILHSTCFKLKWKNSQRIVIFKIPL